MPARGRRSNEFLAKRYRPNKINQILGLTRGNKDQTVHGLSIDDVVRSQLFRSHNFSARDLREVNDFIFGFRFRSTPTSSGTRPECKLKVKFNEDALFYLLAFQKENSGSNERTGYSDCWEKFTTESGFPFTEFSDSPSVLYKERRNFPHHFTTWVFSPLKNQMHNNLFEAQKIPDFTNVRFPEPQPIFPRGSATQYQTRCILRVTRFHNVHWVTNVLSKRLFAHKENEVRCLDKYSGR